ncbi:MAG: autotransporter assembly complex family protein [Thiolinea sp.]
MTDKADKSGLLFLLVVTYLAANSELSAAEEEGDALINLEKSPIEVVVSGAPDELADNLKAFLPSLRNLKCDSDEERVQRFIDASDEKLVEGAEAMGYFSAGFKMTSERRNDCWQLNIAVEPGQPVRIREQNISLDGPGKTLEAFTALMAKLPYEQGDVFVNSHYEDFKTQLNRTASRLGFFDAEFEKRRVLVNVDNRTADIELSFKTGKRYQFGEVKVEQDVLDQRFIDRYIRVEKGQTYDSDVLLDQRRVLESSGYYKDVQVSSRFSDAENSQVPVEITTVRRDRYTYTANVGYATDTNFRIETGMEAHWVNRRGHKMEGRLRLSQNDPAIGASYTVPLWNPEHEYASFSVDWSRSDAADVKGEKLEFELNYNRLNDSGWKQTAFISFLNEKTQVTGEPEVQSQLTLLGARVSKTERNDALFPTEGWRVRAEVQGAHDSLLSDLTLLQASVEGKYLYTFDHKGKAIVRGEFGTSLVDEFNNLPKSLRFFTGGQNSVRGYGFEAIGEKDAEGKVVGGKHKLVLSTEYEYPVTEKISLAAFVDAGTAFDEWNDYGFEAGYGVGARYRSPLGPIRVDLAVPENDPGDIHFYFSLGPDL